MTSDRRRTYLPSPRQLSWLIAFGLLSVGYALYLRYRAVEPSNVGLACEAGLATWLCSVRKLAIALFTHSVFGWLALAASLLNLLRPQFFLFAVAVVAAGFGIVLYNVGLSALAVGLLILSLARPAPATE